MIGRWGWAAVPATRRALPIRLLIALLVAIQVPSSWAAPARETPKLVVFRFAMVDSSLEGEVAGPDPEEATRLDLLDHELRARLVDTGSFMVVPAEEKSRLGCRACEVAAAEARSADFALSGWVQKVSDLILNINLRVTAADSGRVVFLESVDIRGNSDQSWLRGLRYLIDHHLLAPSSSQSGSR